MINDNIEIDPVNIGRNSGSNIQVVAILPGIAGKGIKVLRNGISDVFIVFLKINDQYFQNSLLPATALPL
jgi:hypothetical protein